MIKALYRLVDKNKAILLNTGSLIGTMLVTSVLGFGFQVLAARQFPTDAVGLASAATSAMMLLISICLMGFGTLLITELPRNPGREGPLISVALIVVGGSSALGGILFAVVAPYISPNLSPLGSSIAHILLFAAGVCLASTTFLLDQVSIALLRGQLQFWRNALFTITKLIALWLAGTWLQEKSGISIYTTWTIGNLLSLLPLLIALVRTKKWHPSNYRPEWRLLRKIGKDAVKHHILNLIIQVPSQILPIVVTVLLSTRENGWYYAASNIVGFVISITTSLTTVLHATNAADTKALAEKARLTVGLGTLTTVIVGGMLILFGKEILGVFGHDYASHATLCLQILVVGVLPTIIINHYISISRIQDRIMGAVVPITIAGIMDLTGAIIGARYAGLSGLSLGWIIALFIQATYMAPLVIKTLTNRLPGIAIDPFEGIDLSRDLFGEAIEVQPGLPIEAHRSFLFLDMPTDSFTRIVIMDTPTRQMAKLKPEQKIKRVRLTQAHRTQEILARIGMTHNKNLKKEEITKMPTAYLAPLQAREDKKDGITKLPTAHLAPLHTKEDKDEYSRLPTKNLPTLKEETIDSVARIPTVSLSLLDSIDDSLKKRSIKEHNDRKDNGGIASEGTDGSGKIGNEQEVQNGEEITSKMISIKRRGVNKSGR